MPSDKSVEFVKDVTKPSCLWGAYNVNKDTMDHKLIVAARQAINRVAPLDDRIYVKSVKSLCKETEVDSNDM